MHLLVLILGTVLLPKAFTLQCYECVGPSGDCTGTVVECPSSMTQCGVMRVTTYMGGIQLHDLDMKSCTMADQCDLNGSVNYGTVRTLTAFKCCSTDNCTQLTPKVPSFSFPNGKRCHTCVGLDCTDTLSCSGNEDHCISAKVQVENQEVTVKGCASRGQCLAGLPGPMAGSI